MDNNLLLCILLKCTVCGSRMIDDSSSLPQRSDHSKYPRVQYNRNERQACYLQPHWLLSYSLTSDHCLYLGNNHFHSCSCRLAIAIRSSTTYWVELAHSTHNHTTIKQYAKPLHWSPVSHISNIKQTVSAELLILDALEFLLLPHYMEMESYKRASAQTHNRKWWDRTNYICMNDGRAHDRCVWRCARIRKTLS